MTHGVRLLQRGVRDVSALVQPDHLDSQIVVRHAGLTPADRYTDCEQAWVGRSTDPDGDSEPQVDRPSGRDQHDRQTNMTDNNAHARSILETTSYVVLATADTTGRPWATPVWFAADGLDRIYWLSWPGSRHSVLIEQRPEIALTVFDSTVAPYTGTAFYAAAQARQCADEHVNDGLRFVNRRSLAEGIGQFTRPHVTGESRLRLYVAEVTEAWVTDQDAEVDQRAPVPR